MDLDNVLKLIDAGFTADEIRAYASQAEEQASQAEEQASQAEEQASQAEEQASQGASMSADIIDALNAQFDRLTKVIQANNINTMSHSGQKAENVNDVMAQIINGRKG